MYSSDLVPLLGKGNPGPELRFRQGVVVSWNASTGANVIELGGAELVDVPILNTGEAIALKAGHIVGLLTFGSSVWILGRITVPGASDFASASVAFASHGSSGVAFAVSTSFVQKSGGNLVVPTWADEALVYCGVNASIVNTNAGVQAIAVQATIAGIGGGGAGMHVDPNFLGTSAAAAIRVIPAPGATIAVGVQVRATAALIADGQNIANVDAIAMFRSTT